MHALFTAVLEIRICTDVYTSVFMNYIHIYVTTAAEILYHAYNRDGQIRSYYFHSV